MRSRSGTVLVVDDDPAIVELLEMALKDEGYAVLTAVDGPAVEVAQEAHPDVIVLDLMMPRMDGIAVSQRLRADPQTAPIPIIAMSADHQLLEAARPLVNDRLTKPFDLGRLCAMVARWIRRARQTR